MILALVIFVSVVGYVAAGMATAYPLLDTVYAAALKNEMLYSSADAKPVAEQLAKVRNVAAAIVLGIAVSWPVSVWYVLAVFFVRQATPAIRTAKAVERAEKAEAELAEAQRVIRNFTPPF